MRKSAERCAIATVPNRHENGTFTHAIKGNVDILIALVMHTGAAIGAQIGAISTQYFAGPKIRLAFVPLPLIGAAIVIYTLFSGHKL